ncbi:MAG: flavodoxin reductase [Thermoflavifilum sp.]|nr:flavodoxin reductase [Thermoflavifilum sp.]
MEQHIVKILSIERVTHNVKHYRVQKPAGYRFTPGQATEVAIRKPGWENERRPFTFTSLNSWDFLEFTIKSYHDHPGVTHELDSLQPGDELLIHDVWGAIQYKGEGVFIAGGAGVTPFIAILRQLYADGQLGNNMLIFSNKTKADIILENEFRQMLGDRFINTLTQESAPGYDFGKINAEYLKKKISDFHQHFYVCGPDPMVQDIKKALHELGAPESAVVVEL